MDILKILEENEKDLCLEDLEFFKTELNTGGYSTDYRIKCFELLFQIKQKFINKSNSDENKENKNSDFNVLLDQSELNKNTPNDKKITKSPEEVVQFEISILRKKEDYKSDFLSYIENHDNMDEIMIDKIFKFFKEEELEYLLEAKKFTEDFLEKYFSELNTNYISRYQFFSEEFFMKHFSELNTNIVLVKGINPWKNKSKRSSKLTIFLKLKGVTI